MTSALPALCSVLRSEDGCALVVPADTEPMEALRMLVQEEYGGDLFAADNPALLRVVEGLKIEPWRSCTKAYHDAAAHDDYATWWAPDGDGEDTIHVLYLETNAYMLGEEAEAAEVKP